MAESLNSRELDADWMRHFENMLNDGVEPAEAAESMLRIAALIGESVSGARKTAASLVRAAMFFTQRIRAKNGADSPMDDATCAGSQIRH